MSDGESTSTVGEQVWAVTLPAGPTTGQLDGAWNVPIELPLPPGPYETRLADRQPRYWELEVRGEATGVDFGAMFLLPVYGPTAAEPPTSEPPSEHPPSELLTPRARAR